jgi:Family of unknown function (DUF5685)
MFGIIRPCRHRLGGELAEAWRAQLCGLCLALRDDYGQTARIATNYDGLVVSLLVEAQSPAQPTRRTAGPCPLRGMRRADVATGDCVRLAAVVSLALAAARVRDHVDDRDGLVGRPGVRPAARRIAERWVRQGTDAGHTLGFDTGVLVAAMDRQAELEATAGPGTSLLLVTEPTETAVAAAFGHTALLAGRPANEAPLREVGQLFGRVAHLLDAVEDLPDDVARGKWNPLAATGTPIEEVRARGIHRRTPGPPVADPRGAPSRLPHLHLHRRRIHRAQRNPARPAGPHQLRTRRRRSQLPGPRGRRSGSQPRGPPTPKRPLVRLHLLLRRLRMLLRL